MSARFDAIRVLAVAAAILCCAEAHRGLAQEAGAAAPAAGQVARLDFEALKETRLFPLFSPSRRPPPAPEAPVEAMPPVPVAAPMPVEPTPPSVELVGIVEMDGSAVALLKDASSGLTRRVRTGQSIDDWQLRVVGPRMVALGHPDASEQRILRVARP